MGSLSSISRSTLPATIQTQIQIQTAGIFSSQFIDQLQRQRSARSLVTRDGRRQERDVRSEKLLREGQWNRGSFIDEEKLCLREFVGLGGHDVLNDLAVRFEDVHTDDDVQLVLLRGVDNLVVRVLLDGVSASVEWL